MAISSLPFFLRVLSVAEARGSAWNSSKICLRVFGQSRFCVSPSPFFSPSFFIFRHLQRCGTGCGSLRPEGWTGASALHQRKKPRTRVSAPHDSARILEHFSRWCIVVMATLRAHDDGATLFG